MITGVNYYENGSTPGPSLCALICEINKFLQALCQLLPVLWACVCMHMRRSLCWACSKYKIVMKILHWERRICMFMHEFACICIIFYVEPAVNTRLSQKSHSTFCTHIQKTTPMHVSAWFCMHMHHAECWACCKYNTVMKIIQQLLHTYTENDAYACICMILQHAYASFSVLSLQ